jgi:polysaccharide export outer membrane protein
MKFLVRALWILVIGWFTFACVPNRKITLVQKNDIKDKNVAIDSVVRTYRVKVWDYKIQPQDVLSIRFESLTPEEFDFLNMSGSQQVNMVNPATAGLYGELVNIDGNVTYPVVGKVHVAGLTIFEIQDKLQKLADQFLDSPKVVVRLLNFRVSVLGEVNREQQITLTNNRVSILEAIGLAGGVGELADRSRVKLIRQKGDSVDVQYLNLLDENLILSPYYYVYQNDIIVVPPLRQRNFRKYFGPNLALVTTSLSVLLLTLNFVLIYQQNQNP